MPPTITNGKICYLELPAADIRRSADFYANVFGWEIRQRGDGRLTFHDGVEVSGTWVSGRPPETPGLMIYVMVDDVPRTCDAIVAHGGEIVQPVDAGAPEVTALFRDPGGNILGLYQPRK